jgi:hypothetical protein
MTTVFMLCCLQVSITPALSALYDEAVAFSKQYAAEHSISTADQASRSFSSSTGEEQQDAATQAGSSQGQAAPAAAAAAGVAESRQPAGGLGPRSLFELMARQVCFYGRMCASGHMHCVAVSCHRQCN